MKKWIGISGSWRKSSEGLVNDVELAVENLVIKGNGVVTGGALGVDYVATQYILDNYPTEESIRVILPTSLELYSAHYRKRAHEGVILSEQAEMLISQLNTVDRLGASAMIEMNHTEVNQISYYSRNTKVIEYCDELLAFQVNNSQGTQDAIDKALELEKNVTIKRYSIE